MAKTRVVAKRLVIAKRLVSDQLLTVRNVWEFAAYVELTSCDLCRQGPLCLTTELPEPLTHESVPTRIELTCPGCGRSRFCLLQLSEEVDSPGDAARSVESGRQPSTIIDLAGWLILSQIYQEQSRQAPDSTTAREFDLNARKCLDEALRFFDASQDTPPPEAFFSQESLERFRDRPEPFSRWRIINLRATLPKKM